MPPLAYSLTPSPTFHRLATGVPGGRSDPATARCGGQSSLVTIVDRIRARSKPGISSCRSASSSAVSAASSKSPVAGLGTAVPTYRCHPSGAISGQVAVKFAA